MERSGGAVLPAFRRSPALQPAVAPVEEAFVASARRAAFIAAAFVLLGLLASLRLRNDRATPVPALPAEPVRALGDP